MGGDEGIIERLRDEHAGLAHDAADLLEEIQEEIGLRYHDAVGMAAQAKSQKELLHFDGEVVAYDKLARWLNEKLEGK